MYICMHTYIEILCIIIIQFYIPYKNV